MTSTGDSMLTEYREVFLEELEEQLQVMDDEILKLEQAGSDEVVQSLFRAAHTLKGSSAVMGYEDMKQLTHHMEHLLDQVRSKKREVTSSLTDLLFKSLDCLKLLKSDIVQNVETTTDISNFVRELQLFAESPTESPEELPHHTEPTFPSFPELNLSMRLAVQEAQENGTNVFWIHVRISLDCLIKGARAYVIHSKLSEWGEVLLSSPELDSMDEQLSDSFTIVTFLYAGSHQSEDIHALVANLSDVAEVQVERVDIQKTEFRNAQDVQAVPIASEKSKQAGKAKSSPSIRVSVERLDHLMNLVGELVIDQTRIHQIERTQKRRLVDESVGELADIADHLSRIIGDLQESVMKARMLQIEQLFNRFPRMIRDLSRDLGKELELIMEGKDTELDRTLIEEIADPMIHLIRNALDHGLETPEKRKLAGKSPQGKLLIRATHEDNQVVICIEDDGAGIDPAKMKASALNKGVITQEEAELLSDKEAIELIFRPGFSTAQTVSDVSGRGVGMDIVRSHIEKINGLIDIQTKLGRGTRFQIKLPLTLAIIVGLLVKLQNQTFIIPMSNIAEIVRVTEDEIKNVQGRPVILIRHQVIPVVWLHDHLGINRGARREIGSKKTLPLVIVGSAEKRLALIVDDLIGNQEIVIKSLGSYLGKVDGIAGATILGNGGVALILEISALFD
ncbi:MAG: chemotaxis protein CheA [Candidatus Cohnella colombiensis]|uniref:Chemotaxis protein CheA n=1 Tax=Candidatus Cohnella colombiensis TaxID=3121368 RepID=A0AA95EX84_9BACL|nr:MAG: chemotaxis protein CheA [Cohnella sp.]